MRSLVLALTVLAFATAASAAGPYTVDTKGRCHDPQGHAVASGLCTPHRNVVCKVGKPCGPTCIPKNHVCRRR